MAVRRHMVLRKITVRGGDYSHITSTAAAIIHKTYTPTNGTVSCQVYVRGRAHVDMCVFTCCLRGVFPPTLFENIALGIYRWKRGVYIHSYSTLYIDTPYPQGSACMHGLHLEM